MPETECGIKLDGKHFQTEKTHTSFLKKETNCTVYSLFFKQSEGHGMKEATYINKSLSFLEQVIMALSEHHREHIPFRQSKLTYALKDSLGKEVFVGLP